MIKYGKIINEETGLCEVGLGTDIEYYINQKGYIPLDVQESDVDFSWYLVEKCVMKTDEEKIRETQLARMEEIKQLLRDIDEQRIRAIAEPGVKDESTGETWLEYYNKQAGQLREEFNALEELVVA